MPPFDTSARHLSRDEAADATDRPAPKYVARAMDLDMFRQGGAGKNSHGAKTNHAIRLIACPHDLKASAADGEWRPDTVKTTQDEEREFFSPAQATPLNAQESVASFDF